jgi:hypothetical protein
MTTRHEQTDTTTGAPTGEPSSTRPAAESSVPGGTPVGAPDQPSTAATEAAESSVPSGTPVGAPDQPSTTATEAAETPAPSGTTAEAEGSTDRSLFADNDLSGLRSRWDDVQAGFVDDPKDCVQKADALVADVVERLTAGFSDARARLESQWARGEDASTEDLRQALRRYREFFQRLLAV